MGQLVVVAQTREWWVDISGVVRLALSGYIEGAHPTAGGDAYPTAGKECMLLVFSDYQNLSNARLSSIFA